MDPIRICPDCGNRLTVEAKVNSEGDNIVRLACVSTCAYRGEWVKA